VIDRHFRIDRKTLKKVTASTGDAAFDVKALNLRYGERLVDKIDHKLRVVDVSGNIVDAESFKPDLDRIWTPIEIAHVRLLNKSVPGSSRLSPWILINVVVVIGLACWMLWNRRALAKQS